jgi:hypothetical protein
VIGDIVLSHETDMPFGVKQTIVWCLQQPFVRGLSAVSVKLEPSG